MTETTREAVEALAAKLDSQLVMSKFLTSAHRHREQERQRSEAAATLRALLSRAEAAEAERDAIEAAAYERAAAVCADETWRHEGDDAYSRGLDRGALEQASACAAAIRALSPTDAREALDRAIAEAVEKERERCSKVAETAYRDTAFFLTMHEHGTYNAAVSQIAAAIREGKE